MSTVREELNQLLESLSEEELDEVRDFVKVLSREPEELTDKEWHEVQQAEEEFRRGDWVRWPDIRRKDV